MFVGEFYSSAFIQESGQQNLSVALKSKYNQGGRVYFHCNDQHIVDVHFPHVDETLIQEAISKFYWIRSLDQIRKAPATSELIDWIAVLIKGGIPLKTFGQRVPYLGTLLKKEQDILTLKNLTSFKGKRR